MQNTLDAHIKILLHKLMSPVVERPFTSVLYKQHDHRLIYQTKPVFFILFLFFLTKK